MNSKHRNSKFVSTVFVTTAPTCFETELKELLRF